jgi:hypothetical protein
MQPPFKKLGLTGIEPITFRYERNILPLNYRFKESKQPIEKFSKIAKKSYIKI